MRTHLEWKDRVQNLRVSTVASLESFSAKNLHSNVYRFAVRSSVNRDRWEVVKVRQIIRELESEGWFLSRQGVVIDSFIIRRGRAASPFPERWATTSPK
jgi:hypothetical protein